MHYKRGVCLMSAFPPPSALGIPPGEGTLADKCLDDWETVSGKPVLVDVGIDKIKMVAGLEPSGHTILFQFILHISQSKMATISNNNQRAFSWENCALLCSVRPAPTIFILMADLGFLRTTEYTGYSCPSNKTLLLSPALLRKRDTARDTQMNWRSSQPSETIRKIGHIDNVA